MVNTRPTTIENPEVPLRLMEESMSQARHLENQRTSMTNFLITISAGIIAYVTSKNFSTTTISLDFIVITIGVYGLVTSLKYSQRYHLHYIRAKVWREHLLATYPDIDFDELYKKADRLNAEKFKRFAGEKEKFEFFYLWGTLYILLIAVGVVFLLISIVNLL